MKKVKQVWVPMAVMVLWLAFLSGSFVGEVRAEERGVVVMPLTHTVPEQVLPTVKALLPEAATATAFNNQLILKVTPAERKTVEALLLQIDKAPKQLLISVRTPQTLGIVNEGISVSSTGAGGRVTLRSDSLSSKKNGQQSVRATEGMPAHIVVGISKPVTSYKTDSFGNMQAVSEYKAADQGFYVTARLAGEGVQLQIRQADDHHEGAAINSRHLSTTVAGKLGEWITLGRTGADVSGARKGLVVISSSSKNGSGSIQLKVQVLE